MKPIAFVTIISLIVLSSLGSLYYLYKIAWDVAAIPSAIAAPAFGQAGVPSKGPNSVTFATVGTGGTLILATSSLRKRQNSANVI
jgi:hypothetical protein